MRIIKYMDNDELNKPETGRAPVYSVESNKQPVNKETLLNKDPEVSSEGVGERVGEHKSVDPVQHAPHRLPV